MKKLIYILVLLTAGAFAKAQAQPACCPEFALQQMNNISPCQGDSTCQQRDGTNPAGQNNGIVACKNSTQLYTVVPNLPGFTYNWQITGGTPLTATGNPVSITWGGGGNGTIEIFISDASGNCRDTIRRRVCLLNAPVAAFSVSPGTTVCANTLLNFTNNSVGASTYSWSFGDGSGSSLPSPSHTYTTPGTYTVVLTVTNASGGGAGQETRCGCTDIDSVQITVLAGTGPVITSSCNKMLCMGDTATYCAPAGCAPYTWTVNGGTIIGPATGNCVTVRWNVLPSVWPSSINVSTGCSGPCGSNATLNVPVLYPNIPIQGPNIVCPNSMAVYSLPALPGTFYNWTISGGGTIVGYDSNHNVINVQWGSAPGPHIITCNYNNPYSKCSGMDTISISIKPRFTISGPSPLCQNTTGTYLVAGGGSANWTINPTSGYTPPGSPPGTFTGTSSITLTWNTAGSYNISAVPVTPANYCNNTAGLPVIVNLVPVLNPTAGPTTVCPGQLYTYTASSNIPGGSFTWTLTGGGTVSAYGPGNAQASVIFTGTGPWTLVASQTANGCTGSYNLSVSPVPAPPAITLSPGATTCSGGTITASVAGPLPPGGYTWSATPGAVLTAGQGTTTATFTVNSNATITIRSCGGQSTANVTVTPQTVSITPTPGACSVTLTATTGAGPYNWFLDGNPVGSGNPFIATQNGTYVVQAIYPGGCQAISQITVNSITPVVTTITALGNICTDSVTFTASVQANCPGAVFTWSNGFVGNPMVAYVPGSYFVTVNCSNGCSDQSNVITIGCGPGDDTSTCINDIIVSQNPQANCSNPASFTATMPPGCAPASTSWQYGDGWGNNTGTHAYTNVGTYVVSAVTTCSDGSKHCDTMHVTIPMVDSFTHVINCATGGWAVQLQDATIFLPAYSGYSILWTTTCGTLSANNISNPILTVPIGCNPTVTLQISKNGCTLNKSFTFSFPTTPFTINGPSTVCRNQVYSYSSSFTTGIIGYSWNFGDGTSGVTNPISHAFNGVPPNPTITLTLTDQQGCMFSTTKNITVITPPALSITPGPIVHICPDCTTPVTLSTTPVAGFSGYQWYQNGSPISGANGPTYQLCNFNASGSYYVTALSAPNNCIVTSDTVQVLYYPKPVADIQGQSIVCAGVTGPYTINLQNAGGNNPNYTYNWTATGPGSVSFTPDNLQFYANTSVTAQGTYQYILTVTDITTGCTAKDTFCVIVYQSPTVSVTAPANMCEGTSYTFNATPVNPNYVYQWSNGFTGPSMTASTAGVYFLTVFDVTSGCSTTVFAGFINRKPYTDIFPIGCDTLCDTDTIVPPLPLGPGQNYGSLYTINWYDGNTLIHTGPFLPAGLLSPIPGLHNIHIEVVFVSGNCISVSGNYDVYVKPCTDCSCEGAKWGDIMMVTPYGEEGLYCGKEYEWNCNTPYTINATYFCPDPDVCISNVTYSLQPPTGPAITGNMPLTYTPTANGTYTLTVYGWCGNKICDSCVITFYVKNCKPCDCKASKWGDIVMTGNNTTQKLTCNKSYNWECNTPFTINAGYICADPTNCPPLVTYSLQPPTGAPVTGNASFTYTPTQNGIYTVTLYGWCGNKICDSCVIKINVNCVCNCEGSHWGDKFITTGNTSQPLNCNSTLPLTCGSPYTVNAGYICAEPTLCPGTVTYQLTGPTGNSSGNVPFTFTPTVGGTYTLTLYGYCNGKLCDSCVVKLVADCIPPPPCCRDSITVGNPLVQTSVLASPAANIANATFPITGPAAPNYVSIRAEVVSYELSDNYEGECLKCKQLPYTWASMYRPGAIGAMQPQITLFNSTAAQFNPAGAGQYQNPREVIWTSGTPFSLPGSINLSFLLPPSPAIACCELKARICVKFTFRDRDCRECEVVICFNVAVVPAPHGAQQLFTAIPKGQ